MIAAETRGRICFDLELDPACVDVIVTRWERFTGTPATLDGDGRSFADIRQERVTQSRRQSLLEAVTNTVVGYAITVLIQLAVFPLFRLDVPLGNSLAIGAIFTATSILPSYAPRRAFEALRQEPG